MSNSQSLFERSLHLRPSMLRTIFEEDGEDDFEGDDSDEGLGFDDDLGDDPFGDSDIDVGDDDEGDEGDGDEDDEEEEEPEPSAPPTVEEIAAQIGGDGLDMAVADALMSASTTAIGANILGEDSRLPVMASLAPLERELRRLYEQEGAGALLPPINITVFAQKIVHLCKNYTVLLDIPGMILSKATSFIMTNYGSEWAEAFQEAVSMLDTRIPIGGDSRGPIYTQDIDPNPPVENPALGPISVGAADPGTGSGGGM